jgi:putative PIN family toxin of toxin-antitoxin system
LVLDTNVFVAAFATHGLCEAIVELCLDQHEIAVSRELLDETKRNLIRKVKLPERTAEEIVEFIESNAKVVTPSEVEKSACRDSSDLKVLGTAVAFEAEYLVTGDKDLFVMRRIGKTQIVSPTAFARILTVRPPIPVAF